MTAHQIAAIGLLSALCAFGARATAQEKPAAAPNLSTAIDQLGSFDFPTRTEAAKAIRRIPAATAVPALDKAVRSHRDEYVRFRALVILGGFGDEAAGRAMRDMMGDRNDRLRTVAYQWFEHHPDPAVLPVLIKALPAEKSEFVRPAVTRAVAAHGADPRARDTLRPLIMRGEDTFRGALISALGDYRVRDALPQIVEVAKLDGPLQDDAITAIGKIGDPSVRPVLAALQGTIDRELQPTLSAAFCLLSIDREVQEAYLKKTLAFAVGNSDYQPLLRGVSHALGSLATGGHAWALTALLDAGIPAADPARAPLALTVGLVALRDPMLLIQTLEARSDLAQAVELLRDAFDMLSEDFEEERFGVELRQAYWKAPEGSARRRATELMVEKLEF